MSQEPLVGIIEDDEDNRDVFRTVLEYRGYRVVEAADGPAGLELIRDEPPDLLLLDLHLPGLDGWSILDALRATPATRALPVIIVTAIVHPAGPGRAAAAGCCRYLTKPLLPADLLREIEACLSARSVNLPRALPADPASTRDPPPASRSD